MPVIKTMLIQNIQIPTTEDLQPLVDEMLSGGLDEETLILQHVAGIASILETKPEYYRNYGIYWWSVKALLIEYGYNLGDEVEDVTKEHCSFDSNLTLLSAAWAYCQDVIESGRIYSSLHTYWLDDEESLEYPLEDMDMEARFINKSKRF